MHGTKVGLKKHLSYLFPSFFSPFPSVFLLFSFLFPPFLPSFFIIQHHKHEKKAQICSKMLTLFGYGKSFPIPPLIAFGFPHVRACFTTFPVPPLIAFGFNPVRTFSLLLKYPCHKTTFAFFWVPFCLP